MESIMPRTLVAAVRPGFSETARSQPCAREAVRRVEPLRTGAVGGGRFAGEWYNPENRLGALPHLWGHPHGNVLAWIVQRKEQINGGSRAPHRSNE